MRFSSSWICCSTSSMGCHSCRVAIRVTAAKPLHTPTVVLGPFPQTSSWPPRFPLPVAPDRAMYAVTGSAIRLPVPLQPGRVRATTPVPRYKRWRSPISLNWPLVRVTASWEVRSPRVAGDLAGVHSNLKERKNASAAKAAAEKHSRAGAAQPSTVSACHLCRVEKIFPSPHETGNHRSRYPARYNSASQPPWSSGAWHTRGTLLSYE